MFMIVSLFLSMIQAVQARAIDLVSVFFNTFLIYARQGFIKQYLTLWLEFGLSNLLGDREYYAEL